MRKANPEKGSQERVPDDCGDEVLQHGIERGEGKAFAMPVVIAEPKLARDLAGFAVVFCLANDAAKAVDDQKCSCGEEEKSDETDEPVGSMLRAANVVQSGGLDKNARGQKWRPEKNGFPSIDGGGALRRMVHENPLGTIGGNADEKLLVRRGDSGHWRSGRAMALPMTMLGRRLGLAYER